MSAEILYIIDAAVLLMIGFVLSVVPYINPPFIQFGVRLPEEVYSNRKLVILRRIYSSASIAISAFLAAIEYFFGSVIPGYLSLIGFVLIYLILMLVIYLKIHYTVMKIKRTFKSTGTPNDIVATTLTDVDSSVNPLIFVLPWAAVAIILAVGLYLYPSLPSTFPDHFNAQGVANSFESKTLLSVLSSVLFIGVPVSALLDFLAIAVLRVGQIQDPSRPIGSKLSIKRFNRVNAYLLVFIALIVDSVIFLTSLVMWQIIPRGLVLIVALLPALSIIPAVMIVALKVGQGGWRTMARDGGSGKIVRDDDRLWKGGIIYYNPEDSSILVPKRFGYGYTLNMAHPVSWLVFVIIVLVPVAIFVFVVGV